MIFKNLGAPSARTDALPLGLAAALIRARKAQTLGVDEASWWLGTPVEPPYGSLDLQETQCRLVAFALPTPITRLDPTIPSWILGLPTADLHRLLGFLLGFCRTTFKLSSTPSFIDMVTKIVDILQPSPLELPPGSLSWPKPLDHEGPQFRIGPSGILRITDAIKSNLDTWGAGSWLIVSPGQGAWRLSLRAPSKAVTVRPAGYALQSSPWSGSVFFPPVPVKRQEDPTLPVSLALDAALPDGGGGVFLSGWIRDPLHLVTDTVLHTPAGVTPIPPDRLFRMERDDLNERFEQAAFQDQGSAWGFVAHLPDVPGLGFQAGLDVHLATGGVLSSMAPMRGLLPSVARDAVLGCVPPGQATPKMLDECLGPAAARLHARHLDQGGAVTCVAIGTPLADPTVSFVVPLYKNLDFLRFQIEAFSNDPDSRKAEWIYVLDSPEQRGDVEHLLRGLHLLHDHPITLIVLPHNLGYAGATNVAATYAKAPALLLLNSDVVPVAPGWLTPMLDALNVPGIGAVGPRMLFDDTSIQHAGLFFERNADGIWFNAHYYKGKPRHWRFATQARRVPGVTGAALLLLRSVFDRAGGICEDYIIGDYEDSDLCLKIRQMGLDISYVPQAELFHFERRSIRMHAGYTRTLASMYNQRLHHARWNDTIDGLMQEPTFQEGIG